MQGKGLPITACTVVIVLVAAQALVPDLRPCYTQTCSIEPSNSREEVLGDGRDDTCINEGPGQTPLTFIVLYDLPTEGFEVSRSVGKQVNRQHAARSDQVYCCDDGLFR